MANPPCDLQFTPFSAAMEGHEFNFRGLYLQRFYAPGRSNQWELVSVPVGHLLLHHWFVKAGPGKDAKSIAVANGLHISKSKNINGADFHQCFTIQFVDERFSGSTLQVNGGGIMGPDWAVVGGTGHFAMATGVINKRPHQTTEGGAIDVVELTIQGFCPRINKGSMTTAPVQWNTATKIGPWGGAGGSAQDITTGTIPKRLESVTIRSGSAVDSISFSYFDQDGEKRTAGPWGGSGGTPHTIQLSSSEFVKEVSGTFGVYSDSNNVINSLRIVTNLKTYGPFGQERGTPFGVPVQGNSGIVGFFARSGGYLDALGVYVHPL